MDTVGDFDSPQPLFYILSSQTHYTPHFDREYLAPLGDNPEDEELLLLVTVTVPKDITKTTVNLRAPIIVNADSCKAVQLINEDEQYSIKYAIYDDLMAKQH